jgi:hypothetical protein
MIRSEVEALRGRGIERFGVNLIPAATAADRAAGPGWAAHYRDPL